MIISSLPPEQQAKLLNGPALAPPPGVVPKFDNPPNNNLAIQIPFAIFVALVTIAVSTRMYIRYYHFKQRVFGDYLVLLGYVFFIAEYVLVVHIAIFPGVFVHQWNVRLKDLAGFLHFTFVSSTLYSFVVMPVKVAILLEWLRLFSPMGIRNLVFWTSHILIWANVIFYCSTVIVLNISCTPYEYTWNRLIAGSCKRANTTHSDLAVSVFNVVSDTLILLVPQRAIWKLQLDRKKKLGISFVFAIGLFGIGAAVGRLVETVRHAKSRDFTYSFSPVMLFSGIEMTCAFLVICVPSFPKAFREVDISKLKQSLSFWSSGSSLGQTQSSPKQSGDERSWPPTQTAKFSEMSPENGSKLSDEHQLYSIPKPTHKKSSEQSIRVYDVE